MHVFAQDNEIGKRGEAIFRDWLDSQGCTYTDVSDDPDYQEKDIDFVVDSKKEAGKTVTVEVKNDTKIARTRNVFFETMSNVDYSTKGCFSKTEADLIAIVSEDERKIYFIGTGYLKTFVEKNKNTLRFISRVPGSNSCGYLVPLRRISDGVKEFRY